MTKHSDVLHPSYSKSLFLDGVKLNSLFFLPGFSFTNIYDSQDSRESGRLSLYILLPLPLAHRHLDIGRVIAVESSPLCKAGS